MPGKDFDALLPSEREFTVRGKKFHFLDLGPEEVFGDVDVPEGAGPWEVSDLQIMRYLPENEHETWRSLRSDKENPVTIKQINAVFAWLWEEATGLPLPQAEQLDNGGGRTDTSSTARSRSRAGTSAA